MNREFPRNPGAANKPAGLVADLFMSSRAQYDARRMHNGLLRRWTGTSPDMGFCARSCSASPQTAPCHHGNRGCELGTRTHSSALRVRPTPRPWLVWFSSSSGVTRNRTVVRCHAVGEIEHHVVDIAPTPALRRIVALDNGMAGGTKMLGCMTVR